MKSIILAICRHFSKKTRHDRLMSLYEETKFKLPFHLTELANYKFILERTSISLSEREEFTRKHTEARCTCLKLIQDLDNLVCDLDLQNRYEAHIYMDQYKAHSQIICKALRVPYFTPNNN